MNPGLLVVLEGPEGAGKSTQAARISALLEANRIPHLLLREPGGTTAGEEIRNLLLDSSSDLAPETECLLFLASRAELVRRVLRPALDEGRVVVLDRFFLSTYAYQIGGRGLDEELVRAGNALATAGLKPDITLLLTIDPRAGLERAARRGETDRMEMTGNDFHQRVAASFALFGTAEWQRRHPECGEIVSIDASRSASEVFDDISRELQKCWPTRLAVRSNA